VIWAKREFTTADDYGPYLDRFADLHLKLHGVAGMMMVKAGNDVIISLPDTGYLSMFDGFKVVDEGDLPKEVTSLYVDQSTDHFERRFKREQ
jgi:hypothetical protein